MTVDGATWVSELLLLLLLAVAPRKDGSALELDCGTRATQARIVVRASLAVGFAGGVCYSRRLRQADGQALWQGQAIHEHVLADTPNLAIEMVTSVHCLPARGREKTTDDSAELAIWWFLAIRVRHRLRVASSQFSSAQQVDECANLSVRRIVQSQEKTLRKRNCWHKSDDGRMRLAPPDLI
ncbi:hypothetical protein AXG93_4010s1150 [Marchantia polymorpha subsp. ruderalis]|uniref:Secreted protein n=1 Tax=Marchantia polymorpha subsp. ruderalis TaxID=1480154 RepID=A0A176VH48_MARPO|nr:hypothetical protein AXG93_4010s1150 [Marchantia polymorpha subsp. ruderalis]